MPRFGGDVHAIGNTLETVRLLSAEKKSLLNEVIMSALLVPNDQNNIIYIKVWQIKCKLPSIKVKLYWKCICL